MKTRWDCFVPRNDDEGGGNYGEGVGCGAAVEIALFIAMTKTRGCSRGANPHLGIVIASKREGTVQGGYFICEAIPSGEV